jgi:cytochrome c oxidase subunit III
MSDATATISEKDHKVRARKNVTYLLLFAIVMFFVALSSAYVVSQSNADYWVTFRIPQAFYYSTALIVLGSITVQLALGAARRGNRNALSLLLVATLLTGAAFTVFQMKGWKELFASNLAISGKLSWAKGEYGVDYSIARKGIMLEKVGEEFFLPADTQRAKPFNAEMEDYQNTASSYFYVLTIGHWLHLLGGLVAVIVLSIKAFLGRYTADEHTGVWQGAMYWHFLGGLWIYLLLFIAFVH